MSDFVSFPLFGFTLVIRLKNLKVIEILFDKKGFWIKKMMPDLNMFSQIVSDFTLFRVNIGKNVSNTIFKQV